MAKRPSKVMGKRAVTVMLILFLIGFGADIIALARLQLVDPLGYKEKAAAQQISDVTFNAQRGTIYDSNMNVIAQSATVWKIFLDPSKIPDDKLDTVVKQLVEILEVDEEKLRKNASNKKSGYYVVKEKVENDAKEKINKLRMENAGYTEFLGIESDTKRYYPNNNFASSVIGFTGAGDIGRSGLEMMYDKELTGTPGRTITAVDAKSAKMTNGFEAVHDAKPEQTFSSLLTR